ncbi:hypothetical protein RhiirB3_424309 [Rhizophagus irregularis]|nr:hypothetical protein RhiirB3_424309 [Rhizophagus irregularis]
MIIINTLNNNNNKGRIFYESKFVAGLSDLDVGICLRLSFLHGCQILNKEINDINERLEPKVASFNFGGSAKYGRYFAEVCSVHSLKNFSMLLWKIAFDVIPYRNWNYTNIIDRIKADLDKKPSSSNLDNNNNNNIIIDGDNDDPISEATVILPMIQPLLLLEDEEAADSQLRYAFSLYHDQIIKDTDAFLQYLML